MSVRWNAPALAGSRRPASPRWPAPKSIPRPSPPGPALDLTLGRRATRTVARPLESLDFRARFDLKLKFVRNGDALTMVRQPIAVDTTPMRIAAPVGSGVYVTATGAGAPAQAVQTFIRAIASKVELGSLDPSARFDMIVERERAATGEVRYGKLLYAGMTQGDRTTRMIEWTVDGRNQWFDAAGVGQRRSGFTVPVQGHQTSGFGMRFHPLLGYTRMHQGVDYGAAYGTPHSRGDRWHGQLCRLARRTR